MRRALVLVLLLAATASLGGDPPATTNDASDASSPAAQPSDWEFEVAPYLWISAVYGAVDVKGRTAQVSVTPLDLLQAVFDGDALAAAAFASARWRRLSLFVDAYGGGVRTTERVTVPTARCNIDVDAKVKMRQAFVDVGIGGDIGRWALPGRERPFTIGAYAGMRYVHMGTTIDSTAQVKQLGLEHRTDATVTYDWADPMIGIRVALPLHDRLSLDFRGDIGGFGASSDLVWGLVGDVRYWMEWNPKGLHPWVGLGYRAVAFDRGDSGARVDMQFRGPTSALGFVF